MRIRYLDSHKTVIIESVYSCRRRGKEVFFKAFSGHGKQDVLRYTAQNEQVAQNIMDLMLKNGYVDLVHFSMINI